MKTTGKEALYVCGGCGERKRGTRLPPGWKRVREATHCKDCFRKRYTVRAVTLPVAEPVGSSWAELDAALLDCFRFSTDLANWCVRDLFALDGPHEQTPEAVKTWYGYGAARERYPDFAAWAGAKTALNIGATPFGASRVYRRAEGVDELPRPARRNALRGVKGVSARRGCCPRRSGGTRRNAPWGMEGVSGAACGASGSPVPWAQRPPRQPGSIG